MLINVIWVVAIVSGIIAGALGNHLIPRTPLFSFRRVIGSLLCGLAVIFLWWLTAPDYNPLATDLRDPIIICGAIATGICFLCRRRL